MAAREDFEIWEKPKEEEVYMLAGWRQWADAGAVSSGLPEYLVERLNARKIGEIRPDGFYLYQVPGTHDLVRPVVKFEHGYPTALEVQRSEIFYTESNGRGVVVFLGDEPHMDIERYTAAFLDAAQALGVKRIVGLGGVYGELPYDKERMVSCIYSLGEMRKEVSALAVTLSDYEGGASIESYLCRRAGERKAEFVALYAFVPMYSFSDEDQGGNAMRVENDFVAWLNVMRRVNYMLKLNIDLTDLEESSQRLVELMDAKVDEIDQLAPQLGVREYLKRISDEFTEMPFAPEDEFWEEELRKLFGEGEEGEEGSEEA